MAGNVREWCYNAEGDSENRYILGGAWLEFTYMFDYDVTATPWNRDLINGFRCAIYLDDTESLAEFLAPIEPEPVVDFTDVKAVPNDELNEYIEDFYFYEPANAEELKSDIVETDTESSLYWRMEKITYNAAYGGEEIIAYLFLPKAVDPPYQPVIFFPGGGFLNLDSRYQLVSFGWIDFIIKSGRAVLYPGYKGTFERKFSEGAPIYPPSGNINSDLVRWQRLNREWKIQLAMDLRRSVDCLTTRPDIDMQKLTYSGNSLGARISPIMLAVEDRIRFAVIFNGGFDNRSELPAADPINFAPRVSCDVPMINGEQDSLIPLKTSQEPMFNMLGKFYAGTNEEIDKTHMTYPGGHSNYTLLNSDVRENVLKWMDDHLGPVD